VLASPLAIMAWLCFGIGVLSQIGWIITDGRRPDMPPPVLGSMAGAVGQVLFAPLIIFLFFWSPEDLRNIMGLVFLMVALAVPQKPSWRSTETREFPMTGLWTAAIRRQYFRSRLCIASAGAIAAIALPENMLLCGLGTVAAMNLHYLQAACRNSSVSWTGIRLSQALPFILTFVAFVVALDPGGDGILAAGKTLSYPDLNLTVLGPIPSNDEPTVWLLTVYLGLSLLLLLIALLVDMIADRLGPNDSAHILGRVGLAGLRAGLMALMFILLDPGPRMTASAELLRAFLILVEIIVFFAPSPAPKVDAHKVNRTEAAVQA
jgi:hypothetical protein